MKKIGIIGIRGNWSTERIAAAASKKLGNGNILDPEKIMLDLPGGNIFCDGENLLSYDAIIIKKAGSRYSPDLLDRLEMLRYMEQRGMKFFSSPSSIIRLLDRLSCTITLSSAGIPIPPTTITEDKKTAMQALKKFERALLKPLYTSKARGMMVLDSNNDAGKVMDDFRGEGNRFFYIQKLLEIPGQDLGVVFLGGTYIATYARVRAKGTWSTTTTAGGEYVAYEPPPEVIRLAHKAQSLFNLDFTCVDVAETGGGPVVFEVSAFGGFRGLYEANGIDAAELYIDYVLDRIN